MDEIDELKNSYHRQAPSGIGAGIKTYAVLSAIEAAWKYNRANKNAETQPYPDQQPQGFMPFLIAALLNGWVLIAIVVGIVVVGLIGLAFFMGLAGALDSGQ